MAKDDPSEIATWTTQGIAHYSGQKRTYRLSILSHSINNWHLNNIVPRHQAAKKLTHLWRT